MTAVFWDLDDTLLNTLPGRMRALAHAYEQCLGCPTDPLELWRSHRGASLESLAERLVGADALRFTTAYRSYYFRSRSMAAAYCGVADVLAVATDLGLRHAVVTSKVAWGATEELAEAGLLEFFEAVVGADDTERHKPEPDPIYAAMERLCLDDPRSVLFVGDSPADVWAARNAGCRSVAALWGTVDAGLLLEASPEFQVQEPRELLDIFREVASQ